jgi:hypothetical protein
MPSCCGSVRAGTLLNGSALNTFAEHRNSEQPGVGGGGGVGGSEGNDDADALALELAEAVASLSSKEGELRGLKGKAARLRRVVALCGDGNAGVYATGERDEGEAGRAPAPALAASARGTPGKPRKLPVRPHSAGGARAKSGVNDRDALELWLGPEAPGARSAFGGPAFPVSEEDADLAVASAAAAQRRRQRMEWRLQHKAPAARAPGTESSAPAPSAELYARRLRPRTASSAGAMRLQRRARGDTVTGAGEEPGLGARVGRAVRMRGEALSAANALVAPPSPLRLETELRRRRAARAADRRAREEREPLTAAAARQQRTEVRLAKQERVQRQRQRRLERELRCAEELHERRRKQFEQHEETASSSPLKQRAAVAAKQAAALASVSAPGLKEGAAAAAAAAIRGSSGGLKMAGAVLKELRSDVKRLEKVAARLEAAAQAQAQAPTAQQTAAMQHVQQLQQLQQSVEATAAQVASEEAVETDGEERHGGPVDDRTPPGGDACAELAAGSNADALVAGSAAGLTQPAKAPSAEDSATSCATGDTADTTTAAGDRLATSADVTIAADAAAAAAGSSADDAAIAALPAPEYSDCTFGWAHKLTRQTWQPKFFAARNKRLCFYEVRCLHACMRAVRLC